MVPTCIDDDTAAAAAVNRRTLSSYVRLPNYQNYWIEAGFEEEMHAIRSAQGRVWPLAEFSHLSTPDSILMCYLHTIRRGKATDITCTTTQNNNQRPDCGRPGSFWTA